MSAAPDLAARLASLLGETWSAPDIRLVQRRGLNAYHDWVLEDLIFANSAGEEIPAYFIRPPDGHGPVPALVYAHAHGGKYAMGREELTQGRGSLQGPYGAALAQMGCASLCLEMPCFGARQQPDEASRAKALAWQGSTLFGQMLAEQRGGLAFLASHPAILPDRIGAMGFSMGCTLAWWLAALDPRIHAVSALCCFADIAELVRLGLHDAHGAYMTVPGLLPVARTGQIAGLAAPRPLQIAIGRQDPLTPPSAFEIARRDLLQAYAAHDAQSALEFHLEDDTGHLETPAMRQAVLEFLRAALLED